jgi:uncharacterized protein (TIGR02145 family)
MIIANHTIRPLFLASALCLALMWLSDCARTAGGAGRAAEPGFLANDQILRVYWTYGKSRSPLTEKALVGEDSVWKARSYDSVNYHIETKKGNDGKKVNVGLHAGRIKYELFGVISGNEVVFERPLKEYELTKSELMRMPLPETTCTPVEESVPAAPIAYGKLADARDGKRYRTVEIGGKTWMAENLNYKTGNSWCYENDDFYCVKYGRLYDWETAMTACPSDWHLPTNEEWNDLLTVTGGKSDTVNVSGIDFVGWKGATKLKAKRGWNNYQGKCGNGTDDYGFAALPGGHHYPGDVFGNAGSHGYWWTATGDCTEFAYFRGMHSDDDYVSEYFFELSDASSVRCVGNTSPNPAKEPSHDNP